MAGKATELGVLEERPAVVLRHEHPPPGGVQAEPCSETCPRLEVASVGLLVEPVEGMAHQAHGARSVAGHVVREGPGPGEVGHLLPGEVIARPLDRLVRRIEHLLPSQVGEAGVRPAGDVVGGDGVLRGVEERGDHHPWRTSGQQQRRIRVIVGDPEIDPVPLLQQQLDEADDVQLPVHVLNERQGLHQLTRSPAPCRARRTPARAGAR